MRRRHAAGVAVLLIGALAAAWPALAADDNEARMAQGRALFTEKATPPCALCHTLADAGSEGAIGPVLDELKPDAAKVAAALRSGLGAMPSYEGVLSDEQIEALAWYVSHASGGAK